MGDLYFEEYQVRVKNDWKANWITAPDRMLQNLEVFPDGQIPYGKWIWPVPYVRVHLRRDIVVTKSVSDVKVQFWCDNEFNLFLNGTEVLPGPEMRYDDVRNVTSLVCQGVNHVGIRLYQTNHPDHFTSAIRGGILICYVDGTTEAFLTDESWKAFVVCDFGEGKEPDDWSTDVKPGKEWELVCTKLHPRLCRRSCYFRKRFCITSNVREAVLRCTARGLYDMYINGFSVGEAFFQPGSTEKYQEYQEYDITSLLNIGENVLAAVTGNGWLNCESWGSLWANKPALLAELDIIYKNGRTETVITDSSWKAVASPIMDNDIQFGERVDARQETDGWNLPQTCDTNWYAAEILPEAVEKKPTVLQQAPPVTLHEMVSPVERRKLDDGNWLFDFGSNLSGRARIHIKDARPGQRIMIRYYERFWPNGELCSGPYEDVFFAEDNRESGKASYAFRNMDVYLCKGDVDETYTPRFTYTGARYVCLQGYPGVPKKEDIEFLVFCNDLPVTGEVKTSCETIKSIWNATTQTYRNNIITGPTDCPTREKNFWNGDISVFAATACWYMDNSRFLSRWTDAGRKIEYGIYGWEDEEYLLPWTIYHFYADREILKIKYPVIRNLIERRRKDLTGLLPDGSATPYRDHLAVKNVPSDFYAACFYCRMLDIAAQIAKVLEKVSDCDQYREWYRDAIEAFHEKYYLESEEDYVPRCQGGVILPLAFGLVPEQKRERMGKRLVQYVMEDDYHPTTGYTASAFLLPLLCDFGYQEIAYKVLMQTGYPSWRYMLSTGATTITENWSGEKSSQPGDSMNHYALGSVCAWFFEYLGGIRLDPQIPGFHHFIFRPIFIRELGDFSVSYQCHFGTISSAWKVQGKEICWNFTIPEGTSATVYTGDDQYKKFGAGSYEMRIC